EDVEKIVEGEDEESYASEFTAHVFLNDDEDSGTWLEPGIHKENLETVDDDDKDEKKDDKKDDDGNGDYDDHALLRNKVKGSLEVRNEKMKTPIPSPPRSYRIDLSSDKTFSNELMATISSTDTTTSQDRTNSKCIYSNYKHIPISLRDTNDLIENNLKIIVSNNIIQEIDFLQAEVPALISKEFADQAPKIIEELFKTHIKNNDITIHLTISTSTTIITSADLKQQLCLKMKRNFQDQADDPELWDVLTCGLDLDIMKAHEREITKNLRIPEKMRRYIICINKNDEEDFHEDREPNDDRGIGNLDNHFVWDNISYHANDEEYKEDRCQLLGNPRQEPFGFENRRFKIIKYSSGPAEKYIAIKECDEVVVYFKWGKEN
nr:hypothetical protein [Tanacetum cinerariifolium]